MIFVDTSAFMYAVGKPHPLRNHARDFFFHETFPCTSAEALQKLMHACLPAHRGPTLDAALSLVARSGIEAWPLDGEDVRLARDLHERHPTLSVRDLCHLASCRRRRVSGTLDRLVSKARHPRRLHHDNSLVYHLGIEYKS